MFETEGDTLAQAFKSDHGNYSDGFRKAFHYETISYYRRTDREYVDIESPCLAGLFTGTPKQVMSLIPNAENGLFSRFIFYFMKIQPVWKDVFAITSDNGLDDNFDQLGNDFFVLYQTLSNNPEIQFCLTAAQQEQFNDFFQQIQKIILPCKGLTIWQQSDVWASLHCIPNRNGTFCFTYHGNGRFAKSYFMRRT